MSTLSKSAIEAIRVLVADLARGYYAEIEADGRVGRLTANELRTAVTQYGRTLLEPPPNFMDQVEVYPTVYPGVYRIDVDLWTAEEGRSDLTLSCTIREHDGVVSIEIDDLHVL